MKSELYYSFQSTLSRFLGFTLQGLGFTAKAPLLFVRNCGESQQLLSFPLRLDQSGIGHFHCMVGVRYEALASILGDALSPYHPMILAPIHVLQHIERFGEWPFASEAELKTHRDDLLHAISNADVYFLSQLTTVRSLILWLQSPKTATTDILSTDQRTCLLAAALFSSGKQEQATRVLSEGIEAIREMPKKRSMLMRALLAKLESR